MKILVIEDDPEISLSLRAALEDSGFEVQVARDGQRGLNAASRVAYHAIVLDLMLPILDGVEVCRRLRLARNQTPIMMLTAKNSVHDLVSGLEIGADDYLAKPFDLEEFLARLRALIRRDKVHRSSIIHIGDLIIDTRAKVVTRGERNIHLTAREYSLLEALASHEGQVLSREGIQERVWLDDTSVSNVVEVHIRSLRSKLEDRNGPKLIHTMHRMGYMMKFEAAVEGES